MYLILQNDWLETRVLLIIIEFDAAKHGGDAQTVLCTKIIAVRVKNEEA
jgi:hypothetical protein